VRPLRIAVVGGGWSGLSAAVEATTRGHAVTVYEMSPHWGGRARSVEAAGEAFDNGQHILIGAYRQTLRIMRTVGVDPAQAFERLPLRLVAPDGTGLRLPPGPAVPAFVRGVLSRRGWSVPDRLALLARASGWVVRGFRCDAQLTVAALTARWPRALQRDLVEPLCVAALNTPSASASATVFLRVMRDALFGGAGASDLLLPRAGLGALLPEPAVRWLGARGATLRAPARVESVDADGAAWRVDGEPFDAVVLASSAVEAARLARSAAPAWAARAEALRYEPIVTVYAHSDGTRLPESMLALESDMRSQPAQFVFDLGRLAGRPGLLAFVVSGAQPWLDRGIDEARDATLAQARRALSATLRGPLRPVRVLTEKRATFRCTPSLSRPGGRIAAGLAAAGDYVDGPYPATLEGAVRSAVEAVRRLETPAS